MTDEPSNYPVDPLAPPVIPWLQVRLGPTIKAGSALSGGLDLTNVRLVRITMPLAWTAAPLTFRISTDGVNFNDLFNLGIKDEVYYEFEVKLPALHPGVGLVLPRDFGTRANWLMFRSGTRDKPVTQAADRPFAVVVDTRGWGPY